MDVKIQSLSINHHELFLLIYHQTGLQFQYDLEEIMKDKQTHNFYAIKHQLNFYVEQLFELPFNQKLKDKNIHYQRTVYDKAFNMLRFFKSRNLNLNYVPKKEELSIVINHSPPLYEYLIENKKCIRNYKVKKLLVK